MSSVSTLGLQLMTLGNLNSEQVNLGQLNEQLASGQQYDNLTDYDPTDANNIMNFQNSITQRQAYIAAMNTVQTRLSLYNQTMGDMENIAQQAGALASSNQSLNASTVSQLQAQVQSYLKQLTDDFNQQIGGRYIYAGTRYTTAPVTDLTTLSGTPSWPFTATTSPTLPNYDSQNGASTSFTVNSAPTGNFNVGNTYIRWSDLEAGNVTSVVVNGVSTPVTVTGLTAGPGLTPAQLASNLASTINQLSSNNPGITDFSGVTATNNGSTVGIAVGNDSNTAITTDAGGLSGEITWSDNVDGTTAVDANTNAAAFTADSVTVDSGFTVQYGVTSNNPAFQQLVAGLQFMNAATQTGVSAATYATDMSHAASLLTTALSGIQSLNTDVASNQNLLINETNTQNSDISTLQNQLSNIQQVNVTQVGTEINTLQTQLQASYSATASLEQLSILKYL